MKNVLVTGANRGLGLELVRQLAVGFSSETSNIFAACRDPEKAQALQEIRKSSMVKIHIIKLDVTNESQVNNLPRAVTDILGPGEGLNVLINNAGYNPSNGFENFTKEDLETTLSINVTAPFMLSKVLLPLLRLAAAQGPPGRGMSASRAAILNVSSIGGSFTFIMDPESENKFMLYRASKAGLNMLMRGMSYAVQDSGILMLIIHPGWVSTDMGGPQAPITPPDSVASMLKTLASCTEEQHGKLIDKDGQPMEW